MHCMHVRLGKPRRLQGESQSCRQLFRTLRSDPLYAAEIERMKIKMHISKDIAHSRGQLPHGMHKQGVLLRHAVAVVAAVAVAAKPVVIKGAIEGHIVQYNESSSSLDYSVYSTPVYMRPPLRLLLHSFIAMARVALLPIFLFISPYTFFTCIAQLLALRVPALRPREARRVARAIIFIPQKIF